MKLAALFVSVLLTLSSGGARQEAKKDFYDSGKVKAEYHVDTEGRKHGKYMEYFESGKKRISGSYDHGLKQAEWWEYYESGKLHGKKSYAKGQVSGEIIRMNEGGALLYRAKVAKGGLQIYSDFKTPEAACTRTLDEIRKKHRELDPPGQRIAPAFSERFVTEPSSKSPFQSGQLKKEYLADALKLLNFYRYLAGLRADVKLDEGFCDLCQHGAVLVAAHGELSHTPPKPAGMDDSFFAKGRKGTENSNLSGIRGDGLRRGVDRFMADSGDNNLERVGHRSWILNPAMSKTGFGESESCVGLWVSDETGRPDRPELIAYPSPGFHTVEHFYLADVPWSVAPREGRFKLPPASDFQARMWLLDGDFDFESEFEINHQSIATKVGACPRAVFRPAVPKTYDWFDKKVWVLILKAGTPVFGYFVQFASIEDKEPPAK